MNPKIKFVKNDRLGKYPKIKFDNIVAKESDVKRGDVAVTMVDPDKRHPTVNIRFAEKPERKERTESQRGKKVTKSWVDSPNTIASINTEEGSIHFSRAKLDHVELAEMIEVIDAVMWEFGWRGPDIEDGYHMSVDDVKNLAKQWEEAEKGEFQEKIPLQNRYKG